MRVGIPREVKDHEYRVAITPAGVHELSRAGHQVYVEKDAGLGSSLPDDDFVAAGATILTDPDDVWDVDLVLKVKEPVAEEYHRMRAGRTLFTYLHLAASRECTQALLDSGIDAVAYETVQTADGALPLLAPMSEVADSGWCSGSPSRRPTKNADTVASVTASRSSIPASSRNATYRLRSRRYDESVFAASPRSTARWSR